MQIALALASALLAAATAEAGYDIYTQTVLSTRPSPSFATASAETDAHIASVTHRLQGNALPSDEKEDQEDNWKCDLLAWVRAPDLSPAAVFPAEARLSANGSDCSDIVKWEVGLRLKERGYVRFHAVGVEFPSKPVRNITRARMNQQESHHKIFNSPYHGSSRSGFAEMMNEYYDMLNNETFWEIHSSERVVYDAKHELATADDPDSIPLEAIRAFSVHVPNTQFPPITQGDYQHINSRDAEKPIASAQTNMDYYFALTLRNGSIIERPAGRAGFLPTSDLDISSVKASGKREETTIPLFNPRDRNRSSDDWVWGPSVSNVPKCDTDSRANFSLSMILPDGDVFLQGQNVTLNVTISRVGNGSEVPAFLMVKHVLDKAPTWALSFAKSAEEGASLSNSLRKSHHSGINKLLRVTPLEVHEERRRQSYEDNWSRHYRSSRFWNSDEALRVPLLRISDESQSVSVEFQVPEDIIPSFNTTFQQFMSTLEFGVETHFLCEQEEEERRCDPAPTPRRREDMLENEEIRLAEDTRWSSFHLPRCEKKESDKNRWDWHMAAQLHSGKVPITVVPSTLSPAGSFPIHYTLAAALAPLLLDNTQTTLAAERTFPHAGSELREEVGEEVRQLRYNHMRGGRPSRGFGYAEYRLSKFGPSSGGQHHAASLWQRKMYEEAQAARQNMSTVGGFVVQA